jgi:hypothetical protein
MRNLRFAAAILLALPLLVLGADYFLQFLKLPPPEGAPEGIALLEAMRAGGLMAYIAASHIAVALLLALPRTRFLGGILQLPMSLGIVAFHYTMLREGLPIGLVVLGLNMIVLAHPTVFFAILRASRFEASQA